MNEDELHTAPLEGEPAAVPSPLRLVLNAGIYSVPIFVRIGVGLAMVPLTTFKLGPADFGLFALLMAVLLIGPGVSQAGGTFLVAEHFQVLDPVVRSKLTTSLLWISLVIAALYTVLLILAWPLLKAYSGMLAAVSTPMFAIGIAGLIASVPWGIASPVALIDGRSHFFSGFTTAQTLVGSAATLIALYAFNLGVTALFVGVLAGNIVLMIGSFVLLRRYLQTKPDREWTSRILKLIPSTGAASLAEVAQINFERYLLAGAINVQAVGLYTHAQNYRSLTISGTNVVANTVWPVTLYEARAEGSIFPATERWWRPVHTAVGVLGIAFAATGREMLHVITHGKFDAAAPIVALLIVLVLMQLLFRPHHGVLYAAGQARELSHLRLWVTAAVVVSAIPLVRLFGTIGLVGALGIGELLYRFRTCAMAKRTRSVPFQDFTAWMGIILTLSIVILSAGGASLGVRALTGGIATVLLIGGSLFRRPPTGQK